MRTMPRTRYIPEGSRAIGIPDVAVVYKYTSKNGKPVAIGYLGKSAKAAFHLNFRDDDRRNIYVTEFLRSAAERKEAKARRRVERVTYVHNLKAGDVLHYSWGYDQTNCEYYQVLSATEHSVTIQAIGAQTVPGSEGFMSASMTATRGAFLDKKPMVKRVQPGYNDEPYVKMEFGVAQLWHDGERNYSSWYA